MAPHSTTLPRRAHFKSKNGCRECKRRKVKCGEERPSCLNCDRREQRCSFLDKQPAPDETRPANSNRSHTQSPGSGQPALSTDGGLSNGLGNNGTPNLTMLDMELLHHYSVSTAVTLSSDPVVRNYFIENVPRLGFSHPYVLNSLLALAASHLAHFRPESRRFYYAQAKAHHTAATSLVAPLLYEISPEEAIPLHSFSLLTLFIAFGSLRDEDDVHTSDSFDIFPSWLPLFRGMRTLLEANNRAILSSQISFLFTANNIHKTWNTKQLDTEPLMEFQNYIQTTTADDEATQQLLTGVFENLRRALWFFYGEEHNNEAKIGSMFTWMYKVPDEFLALLKSKNPRALCVLGFFCVLLHRLEYNWWFQGWGTHLIDRLYSALDEPHRFWIRWPIQQIGWVPRREMRNVAHHSISPGT